MNRIEQLDALRRAAIKPAFADLVRRAQFECLLCYLCRLYELRDNGQP
jgi:hypothetical protein